MRCKRREWASPSNARHATRSRKQDDQGVIGLSNADAKDMLDLVQKTKPGPFGKRTREMGNYIGIRDQGRLIAMAGERMCIDGYVEISAVCVDEDWRGKGLAGRLVKILRRANRATGADAVSARVQWQSFSRLGCTNALGSKCVARFSLPGSGMRSRARLWRRIVSRGRSGNRELAHGSRCIDADPIPRQCLHERQKAKSPVTRTGLSA